MQIKKVKIKNFRSFSNKETEININGKFNIFVGENGSGKTSILTAIRYALFGTAGIDIKADSLVNNINKDNMQVTLFCEKDKKEIIIQRGRIKKQSFVKLYINGKELDLPSVKDYDEKIKELIGFDYKMFDYFSINSNIFSNNFFKMKKSERDTFIKKIIGIEDFYLFIDKLKEKRKEFEYNKESLKREIDFTNKILFEKQEKIKRLKENIKYKTIKTIENKLNKKYQEKKEIEDKINILKENSKKENELNKFISKKNTLQNILNNKKNELSKYNIKNKNIEETVKKIEEIKEKIDYKKKYEEIKNVIKTAKNRFYNKIIAIQKEEIRLTNKTDKTNKALIALNKKGTYINSITKGNLNKFIEKFGEGLIKFLFIADPVFYFEKNKIFDSAKIELSKKNSNILKEYENFKNSLLNSRNNDILEKIKKEKKELLNKYKVFMKNNYQKMKEIIQKTEISKDYSKELESLYEEKNLISNYMKLKTEIEKNKNTIKEINDKIKKLSEYKGNQEKFQKASEKLNQINEEIKILEINLNIQKEIKNIESEIKQMEKEKKEFNKKFNEYEEKIKTLDSMIKKDAVLAVNKAIEDFLKIFNFYIDKYKNEMNISKFEIKIKNDFSFLLKERGKIIDYNILSKGEETILNLLMILALNETLKLISNIDFNLLIFDEIDGTLDEEKLSLIIDKIASLGKDVMFVSHRKNEIFELENKYNNLEIYEVKKDFFTKIIKKN